MSAKSWLLTSAPMIVAIAFTSITLATGQDINPTHTQLLDWLLVAFLGSGAIGVSSSGYKKYLDYKKAP